jgi:hypothetical protein
LTQILDEFQVSFIAFINEHYQSFTENDVIDLFANLRNKLTLLFSAASQGQSGLMSIEQHGEL